MSPDRFIRHAVLLSYALLCSAAYLNAQQPPAHANGSAQPGVYLVFPFQNVGASPRLDWLGEGLEELTIQYLSTAGQQVYSHAGRAPELERNGLPFSPRLSPARILPLAPPLAADFASLEPPTSHG